MDTRPIVEPHNALGGPLCFNDDCDECIWEAFERMEEGGCRAEDHGGSFVVFGHAFRKIHPLPADLQEWGCPICGGDVMWCNCKLGRWGRGGFLMVWE